MEKEQEAAELLGDMIETLDNLIGASKLPMPDKFHMERMRYALPNISANLKQAYELATGENPWADHPQEN